MTAHRRHRPPPLGGRNRRPQAADSGGVEKTRPAAATAGGTGAASAEHEREATPLGIPPRPAYLPSVSADGPSLLWATTAQRGIQPTGLQSGEPTAADSMESASDADERPPRRSRRVRGTARSEGRRAVERDRSPRAAGQRSATYGWLLFAATLGTAIVVTIAGT